MEIKIFVSDLVVWAQTGSWRRDGMGEVLPSLFPAAETRIGPSCVHGPHNLKLGRQFCRDGRVRALSLQALKREQEGTWHYSSGKLFAECAETLKHVYTLCFQSLVQESNLRI
jgi:hypothetical protein